MVDLGILKNPIVIGILALALTYLYMWWEEKKRREKNPKAKKRSINIITPVVVGGIAWFVASNFLNKETPTDNGVEQMVQQDAKDVLPSIVGGKKPVLVQKDGIIDSAGSLGSASYHIISKRNVRLPPTDVFIDLAQF